MIPVVLAFAPLCSARVWDHAQALLAGAILAPAPILTWFIQRWQLEDTFEEARRQLGLETPRQWSEGAIRRPTPALLGLFSLVTLLASPTGRGRRARSARPPGSASRRRPSPLPWP